MEVLLFFIALALVTFGLRFAALKVHRASNPVSVQVAEHEAEPVEAEDELLIPILVAAASAVLKKRVVLRRVQFLKNAGGSAWSVTGRLNVMGSHLITKK